MQQPPSVVQYCTSPTQILQKFVYRKCLALYRLTVHLQRNLPAGPAMLLRCRFCFDIGKCRVELLWDSARSALQVVLSGSPWSTADWPCLGDVASRLHNPTVGIRAPVGTAGERRRGLSWTGSGWATQRHLSNRL